MVLILEHLLGWRDLCHMFKFRLWNLYFCSEGLELELLQTGTRAQIRDSKGVTTNSCPPLARLFRSNNGDASFGILASAIANHISSTILSLQRLFPEALLIRMIIVHMRGKICFTHNCKY